MAWTKLSEAPIAPSILMRSSSTTSSLAVGALDLCLPVTSLISMCPGLIEIKDVTGKHRSKAPTANDDVVELLRIRIEGAIGASDSFVQAIADITAHHIQRKVCTLRRV